MAETTKRIRMAYFLCLRISCADRVLKVMGKNGLKRGKKGLEVYVMAEVPSNITLADQFAERFDGFSIGSNDLTQLVLGVDRDSSELADLFQEQHDAVKFEIRRLIKAAHKAKKKVGICGQAPSDYPDFAAFLVREGIDSISLNPDSVIKVIRRIGEKKFLDLPVMGKEGQLGAVANASPGLDPWVLLPGCRGRFSTPWTAAGARYRPW